MLAKIKALFAKFNLQPLWGKLGGKSFLIVAFFALTGFVLAWFNKLTDAYAALAGSLSGFHIGRAIFQDHYQERKNVNITDTIEDSDHRIQP